MLSFMQNDLYQLSEDLYKRILKADNLGKVQNANDLMVIDLNYTNNLSIPYKADAGFAAKNILNKIDKKKY